MKDEALLQAFGKGDKKATKTLLLLINKVVIRQEFISSSAKRADLKDHIQNIALILLEKGRDKRFRLTSSLSTFIWSVSRNEWLARLRRNKVITNPMDTTSNMEALLEREHLLERLESLLASGKISKKCLIGIRMRYYEKANYRNISTRLGLANENVVGVILNRCLNKLRKLFFNHIGDE